MTATRTVLDPAAEERLAPLLAEVSADPSLLPRLLARTARVVGRGPGHGGLRVEDVARARLVAAACERSADADSVLAEAWTEGDADERRAVLLALEDVDVADEAVPIVLDALRTNDLRLVATAMGPYAAAHLPAEHWRHGVLKCLFTGIPLSTVAGLGARRDAELDRMVADYAAERAAAGREVPTDAVRLLATRADTS